MTASEMLQELLSPNFNDDVVKDIVRKFTGFSNFTIEKINVDNSQAKKGDSYLSNLCKFTVEGSYVTERDEVKEFFVPVLVKAMPQNEARRKTFRSSDFFSTEIYFYDKVWPIMKKLKQEKLPDCMETDEVPLCLASFSNGTQDFLALEDVSFKNFRTSNREGVVNFEQTKLGLITLAKFHALGIACRQNIPNFESIANNIKESYFHEKFRDWYKGFHQTLYRVYRDASKLELPEYYLEKLNKLFATDLYGILCDLTKVRNKCTTVTQGDAWIPNFLFNEDSCYIIDFQLARFTTLTNDLVFFIYACTEEKLLESQWDQLVSLYHTALSKRLEELGVSKDFITLEDLQEDLLQNAIFGFGMAMEAKPMSLLVDDELFDLDTIQGTEPVPLEKVFAVPYFKDRERHQRLAYMVKHFIDKGFIDRYI